MQLFVGFDAPRDMMFRIWTDPQYVQLWWGLEGTTNPVCELDVRVGQPATVKIDAFPDYELKGHVASFSPGFNTAVLGSLGRYQTVTDFPTG